MLVKKLNCCYTTKLRMSIKFLIKNIDIIKIFMLLFSIPSGEEWFVKKWIQVFFIICKKGFIFPSWEIVELIISAIWSNNKCHLQSESKTLVYGSFNQFLPIFSVSIIQKSAAVGRQTASILLEQSLLSLNPITIHCEVFV